MIRPGSSIGTNMGTSKLRLPPGTGTFQLLQGSLFYSLHVSHTSLAGIDTICPGEAPAAGGGCKFRKTLKRSSNLSYSNRYNIMSDMVQKNYIDQNAAREIWPNLLHLYHTKKEPTALRMVQGEFV